MSDPDKQLGYYPNHTVVRISIAVRDWHADILSALDLGYEGLMCEAINTESGAATACPPAPGQPTLPAVAQAVAVSNPTQTCEFLWRASRGAGPALPFKFRFKIVDASGDSKGVSFAHGQVMVGSGSTPPNGWELGPGLAA